MVDWLVPVVITLSNAMALWEMSPETSFATEYVMAKDPELEMVPRLPPSLLLASRPLERWRDYEFRNNFYGQYKHNPQHIEQQQARLHRPAATDSSHLSVTILSAVLSRTVTAPLERVKVIQQTAKSPLSSRAVMQLLVKGDSVRMGLFRGNGLNALRAVPLAALQFSTYDYTRNKLQVAPFQIHNKFAVLCRNVNFEQPNKKDLPAPASISMAAACAGVLSVAVTYPLDLLRTRVSLMHSIPTSTQPLPQSQPHAPSQVEKSPLRHPPLSTLKLTRQIVLKEQGGFAALYRGLGLSCVGIVPYMSLSFVLYEAVKPSNSLSYFDKLVAASFATAAAQTATYPFEVVRRMLQVEGMYSAENASAGLGRKPEPVRTAFRIFKDVVRAEGYRGLFRGLLPNLLKVAPATGVSLFIHELFT
ncbi:hypothetical protein HDU78_005430 [Chytriomyces hyalinus]|nr:hypothetical protein HDU78_005430 [Chytriomyces hyalinus]